MPYDPNNYPEKEGGGGSNLIPIGKHIVRVVSHELGQTNGGYAQMIANFEDGQGRTRKAWLIYEGPAGFQLATLLRAAGWNQPLDVDSDYAVRKAIYGKDVEIVVRDETYQGKTEPRVKYINAPPGGNRPQRNPEPRAGGGGSFCDDVPPPNDDDIPFLRLAHPWEM